MAGKKALDSWDPLDKRTKAGKSTNGNKTPRKLTLETH